jgi:ankyrin repeat protein
MTPLMHAARADTALTERLLRAGADLKARDESGMSALLWAVAGAESGRTVPLLLTTGADPNDKQKDGTTALMVAAKSGAVEVIPVLVKAGADLHATEPKRGTTPSGVAVGAGTTPRWRRCSRPAPIRIRRCRRGSRR